ncbi:MAG: lytic transglycosylase domain-containing protein [Kiritimatiellia bacterium]
MKSRRSIWLSWVLAAAAGRPAPAFLQDWEIDYEQISDAGQEIIDRFAPVSFQEQYEFASPEDLAEYLHDYVSPLQDALGGGSLDTLATLRPRAHRTLETLRANPQAQGYADWFEARIDYFDMAAEGERAIPALKPALPPHPTTPQRTLIPHPPAPQPRLIPHPREPEPAPAPKPAPAAKKKPEPAVAIARNRYVENKQHWLAKLAGRPAPARAAALLPDLKRAFRAEGVPPELVWQAEAESTFNPAARSPAGAAGLYQFMPATAQQFGLRLSPEDDRLDALKNARAAAQYLKLLHGRFGNWPLALAAYNCGQGRVASVLGQTGGNTFDDIHDKLPAETRMYVPKIAALVQLRENADLDRM